MTLGYDDLPVRLQAKIATSDGCWEWTGYRTPAGYGQSWLNGKVEAAHRVVYKLLVGTIPDGLQIDHLCNHRPCVRPDHLRAATARENSLAPHSNAVGRIFAAKTHCPYGHPYEGANLYITPTGRRGCRSCRSASTRQYRKRLAETAPQPE